MVKRWCSIAKSVGYTKEGARLILQPVLINKHDQKVYVAKHPKSWKTNYSVWVDAGKGWDKMLASHHRSKDLAIAGARRLQNKDVLRVLRIGNLISHRR